MLSIFIYVIPFLLAIGLLFAFWTAFGNFQRARRAPYFRIRRDATRAAWRWIIIGVLCGAGIAASVRARSAVPTPETVFAFPTPEATGEPITTEEIPLISTITPDGNSATKDLIGAPPTITPTLPTPTITTTPNFATVESRVTPSADAAIDITEVSSGISADLRPVNAGVEFPIGLPRLYVWLEYENMADGVSWSRVLMKDGSVLRSESELWARGEDGIAYYYFDAQTGWPVGSYEIQFYIGDTLIDSQLFSIIN